MAEPWDSDGDDYIFVLQLIAKSKTYRLKGREVDDWPLDGIVPCEKQKTWDQLMDKRTKGSCDMELLVKGGEEYVHFKVLIPLSKMIKGLMTLSVSKDRVKIDCSKFSYSSVMAVIIWAYSANLSFHEDDLIDVVGVIDLLGLERLYARFMKAASGENFSERGEERCTIDMFSVNCIFRQKTEMARISDKRLVGQMLGIFTDQTHTVVPKRYHQPFSDFLLTETWGTMQDGKEKIRQEVGHLTEEAIAAIAEQANVERDCCDYDYDKKKELKKATKKSITAINIVLMWSRDEKENEDKATEIIGKMNTSMNTRQEKAFKESLLSKMRKEDVVVWIDTDYAIKTKKMGKSKIETEYD